MNGEFLNEEVRCGYHVTGEMKKLWAVELDLLEKFIELCMRERLTYYAMFGTLLGAVRHSGFVPWDDDVDVAMPRKDYDRLADMQGAFPYPYFLQTTENDPAAKPRYIRLTRDDTAWIPEWFPGLTRGGHMGIGIDILPLDCVPTRRAAKRLCIRVRKLGKLLALRSAIDETGWEAAPEWKQRLCGAAKRYSYARLAKAYRENCSRYVDGRYYTIPVVFGEHTGIAVNRRLFDKTVMLKFENLEIAAPSGYKSLIKRLWKEGDGIPEKTERHPRHSKRFDAETPYYECVRRYTDVFIGAERKKIFLFGAGDMLRIYMERHRERFPPTAVFDNDKSKWGRILHNVPVYSPALLSEMKDDSVRLIITSLYHREIGDQLQSMGIRDYFVFIDGWKY